MKKRYPQRTKASAIPSLANTQDNHRHVFGVIIAGGSGTRFWPLSRKKKPKQFLALSGKASMLTETGYRLEGLCPQKNLMVVCGTVHAPNTRKFLKGISKK